MSSTVPTTITAPEERRTWGRRLGRGHGYHRGWRQALLDTAYILSGFALATLWWSLLVMLISTGLGLVVTLVGLPILAATLYLWTRSPTPSAGAPGASSGLERRRARTGRSTPRRPASASSRRGSSGSGSRTRPSGATSSTCSLVFFPLAIATFCIAVSAWAVGLGFVAQPLLLLDRAPGSSSARATGSTRCRRRSAASSSGSSSSLVLPWILGLLAAAHAWTVRSLLGRRSSERVEQLTRQRTEAVDAAVSERRRIERDLHDGAQQRLTALAIDLGPARAKLDSDPDGARELVEQAHEDSKQALAELRNLARGIHPAILTDRGLDAALSALAARSPVPVEISVEIGRAAAGRDRVDCLLRRRRGAHERRQARGRDAPPGSRLARRRHADRRDRGRRGRRSARSSRAAAWKG